MSYIVISKNNDFIDENTKFLYTTKNSKNNILKIKKIENVTYLCELYFGDTIIPVAPDTQFLVNDATFVSAANLRIGMKIGDYYLTNRKSIATHIYKIYFENNSNIIIGDIVIYPKKIGNIKKLKLMIF